MQEQGSTSTSDPGVCNSRSHFKTAGGTMTDHRLRPKKQTQYRMANTPCRANHYIAQETLFNKGLHQILLYIPIASQARGNALEKDGRRLCSYTILHEIGYILTRRTRGIACVKVCVFTALITFYVASNRRAYWRAGGSPCEQSSVLGGR